MLMFRKMLRNTLFNDILLYIQGILSYFTYIGVSHGAKSTLSIMMNLFQRILGFIILKWIHLNTSLPFNVNILLFNLQIDIRGCLIVLVLRRNLIALNKEMKLILYVRFIWAAAYQLYCNEKLIFAFGTEIYL